MYETNTFKRWYQLFTGRKSYKLSLLGKKYKIRVKKAVDPDLINW